MISNACGAAFSNTAIITVANTMPSAYRVANSASSFLSGQNGFGIAQDARKQTLTVPDFVLNAIPHVSSDHGSVFLAAHPLQNLFTAPGVDIGFFADLSSDSKEVGFQ